MFWRTNYCNVRKRNKKVEGKNCSEMWMKEISNSIVVVVAVLLNRNVPISIENEGKPTELPTADTCLLWRRFKGHQFFGRDKKSCVCVCWMIANDSVLLKWNQHQSIKQSSTLSVKFETNRLCIWIYVKYMPLPLPFAVCNKLSQIIIIIQLNIWVMNNRNDMRWWFKCGNSAFYFISSAQVSADRKLQTYRLIRTS